MSSRDSWLDSSSACSVASSLSSILSLLRAGGCWSGVDVVSNLLCATRSSRAGADRTHSGGLLQHPLVGGVAWVDDSLVIMYIVVPEEEEEREASECVRELSQDVEDRDRSR